MKKHLLRVCSVLVALTYFATTANSTVLLDENFDNLTAGNLEGQSGWVLFAGSTDPITLVEKSLTYTGYSYVTTGLNARLQSADIKGIDLKKDLSEVFIPSAQNPVLYISFLVKAEAAGTASFISLVGGNSNEYLHVAVVPGSTSGKVKFAVGRNYTVPSTTQNEYDIDKTHLVVVKYTYIEGSTNDVVEIFVDPVVLTKEPAISNAEYKGTNGSDIPIDNGAVALQLRQGQKWNSNAPKVNVDNIKVATTWGELFGQSSEEAKTPIITPSRSEIQIAENLYEGEAEHTLKFNVIGKNLTEDVILSETSDCMTLSATTIAKADAMADGGAEVTVKVKPTKAATYSEVISIKSTGAEDAQVTISWGVMSKVADFKTAMELNAKNGYFNGKVETGLTVTHTYVVNGDNWCYMQDESAAFQIKYTNDVVLNTGDRLDNMVIVYSEMDGLVFEDYGDIVSGQSVEPAIVTIKELKGEPAKYQYRLVKIENVNVDADTPVAYGQKYDISQDKDTIQLSLFAESELIGAELPVKIDLTGISRNASGALISPRNKSDIVDVTVQTGCEMTEELTALVWTNDNTLNISSEKYNDIQIFNSIGQRLFAGRMEKNYSVTLNSGIYIVKIGDEIHKVVIR